MKKKSLNVLELLEIEKKLFTFFTQGGGEGGVRNRLIGLSQIPSPGMAVINFSVSDL